jgi:hypothetical protein
LLFPKPILGVILFFEALGLLALARDTAEVKSDFLIVLLVGLLAVSLPYGYLVALLVGTALVPLVRRGMTGLAT